MTLTKLEKLTQLSKNLGYRLAVDILEEYWDKAEFELNHMTALEVKVSNFSLAELVGMTAMSFEVGDLEQCEIFLAKIEDIQEDYQHSGVFGWTKRHKRNHLRRLIKEGK